jgi:hypothetical protein
MKKRTTRNSKSCTETCFTEKARKRKISRVAEAQHVFTVLTCMPQCIVDALIQSDASLKLVRNFLLKGEEVHETKTRQNELVSLFDSIDELEIVAWVEWKLSLPVCFVPQTCDLFFATCTMTLRIGTQRNRHASLEDDAEISTSKQLDYRPNAVQDEEFWCLLRCAARLQCKVFSIVIFARDAVEQHMSMLDLAQRSISSVGFSSLTKSLHSGSIALIGALHCDASVFEFADANLSEDQNFVTNNTETVLMAHRLYTAQILNQIL